MPKRPTSFTLDDVYLDMLEEMKRSRPGITRVQLLRDLIQNAYVQGGFLPLERDRETKVRVPETTS